MAFEVFDDVAFYFVAVIILSLFLLPPTLFLLWRWLRGKKTAAYVCRARIPGQECTCPGCVAKWKLLELEEARKPKITVWKVLFILGWVLLLYLLWRMPEMKGQDLAAFKPWEILGVDQDASEEEIKRAYRRLAVKLHPDKNRDDPDAEKKFILLTKAYEVMTDETAKANMERYGNPDGYRGTSVTIGLPSFLTKKENEIPVLLLYFLLFIVLPAIAIFFWWRKVSQYHDSGVLHATLPIFWQGITEHTTSKFLIEVLAAAAEFRWLEQRPTDMNEFKKLQNEVKDKMVRQRIERPYVVKGNHLLHAHMLRKEIPACFQEELRQMLKDVPKLLDLMLEMTSSRHFLTPSLSIIELQQCIIQALWMSDSHAILLQLPHITEKDAKFLMKRGVTSIAKFRQLDADKKRKLLPHLTEEHWKHIDFVLEKLPAVEIQHKYEVEDEVGVCEGDIVTITVTLSRLGKDRAALVGDAQSSVAALTREEEDEQKERGGADRKKAHQKEPDELSDSGVGIGLTTASKESKPGPSSPSSSSSSSNEAGKAEEKKLFKKLQKEKSEDELLDELIRAHKKEREPSANAPFVHAPYFPHEKREVWYVSLIQIPKGGKSPYLVQVRKVVNLTDSAQVQFKIQAPPKGTFEYEILAKCDSYMGCDAVSKLTLKVDKARGEAQIWELEASSDDEEKEGKGEGEAEEDPLAEAKPQPGKWYYLGCSSLSELVINAVLLVILGGVILGTLHERGVLQKIVYPIANQLGVYLRPLWLRLSPVLSPVLSLAEPPFRWLAAQFTSAAASAGYDDTNKQQQQQKKKKGKRRKQQQQQQDEL